MAPESEVKIHTSRRTAGKRILQNVWALGGSLLLVPLVIVAFGSYWEWNRSMFPETVTLVDPGSDTGSEPVIREVRLHFYDDGGDPGRGVTLPKESQLNIELPRAVDRFRVLIQVDFNDVYEVGASVDGAEFVRLWQVPRGHGGSYLTTRSSAWLDTAEPVRFLQVRALRGNMPHVVAGLRLELEPREIPHAIVIPLVWGLALLLWGASRALPSSWALRALERWQRADLWVTASLLTILWLRIPPGTWVLVLAALVIWIALRLLTLWWARSPASLFGVIVVAGLLGWLVPKVFEKVIVARIAELHDLTVDHRPLPGPEVNSDRIRFAGEATDIDEEEFVILFAGDSFTYGLELDYDEAYPYVFERLVGELDCEQPVRAVNIGWTSASPLLALRLIREIGYKYHPDLVIYNLDMTDFHDDLSYEARLREGGDLEIDLREAAVLLVARRFPGLTQLVPNFQSFREVFRGARPSGASPGGEVVPEDRFFVTSQPLEESRGDIERGVMRNLRELHLFVTDTLDSSMALVIYPRSYQYSMRESPRNWEAHLYEVLGPYVHEPFAYFSNVSRNLPFPILNLLPAFEGSEKFPLFLEDDPHWSADGSSFVAEEVAAWALDAGLIPCLPSAR